MNMDQKTYEKYVKSKSPKSPLFTDCVKAFLFGGLICIIGEIFYRMYLALNIKEDVVKILVPATLIAIAAILTGLGLFDGIAKHAGAGTLVPITGFSNASHSSRMALGAMPGSTSAMSGGVLRSIRLPCSKDAESIRNRR